VIFDMDGVLLDSEPLHHVATNRVLAREDRTLDVTAYTALIGTGLRATWETLVEQLRLAWDVDTYVARYDAEVLRLLAQPLEPAAGARELLETLRQAGVKRGLASSSLAGWVQAALAGLGFAGLFDAVVSGEMVEQPKPEPAIYLLAASRLAVAAERCLVVEDSPAGATAASRAGMTVVGVRTPYTLGMELPGTAVTVDSLEQFGPAVRPLLLGWLPQAP
jgi:HAD superfamily hydrolase (TIGR01509 family)